VAKTADFELYETLPDGILVVDQKGVIRYANHETGRMFAQEPATLVSTPIEALLPEHLRERHIAHRNKYNSDPRTRLMGEGLDLVGRRANGTTFPVDIMLKPLTHLDERMVLAVVRDMTDRRTAEEALRQTQGQLGRKIRGTLDGWRPCGCRLGHRGRHLHHELDRAGGATRICTEAQRVRHQSYGRNGGALHGWCGRPPLSPFGLDLALDLPSSERAGTR
jgi:PAS domain S-box-containing protein